MKNLEACFKSNEFVNIRFANNDVRKAKMVRNMAYKSSKITTLPTMVTKGTFIFK